MVSDKKVFPTKDNNWVTLARKPMISDSKELEKIFKPHKQLCLLNLPPPEKKKKTFREKERSLFLDICGVRSLSLSVRSEPLTENLRPSPSMQALVRRMVPYIQRFLCHSDELRDVYAELKDNNIQEKIRRLTFRQVRDHQIISERI